MQIYIHLIALSLFDIDQVLPLIGDIHLPHIQWASSIIAYIKNSLKSTIYENITLEPFPSTAYKSTAATSETQIEISPNKP